MDKKHKLTILYIAFGVALFAALTNLTVVIAFLKNILSLILPIIIGVLIAFVLNVPMGVFERLLGKLLKKCEFGAKDKIISVISLLLTLVAFALAITLIITMAVPALAESVTALSDAVKTQWPIWVDYLGQYNINTEQVSELISNFNFENLISSFVGSAGSFLDSVVNVSATIVSGLIAAVFGIVISIYVLLSKKTLGTQCKKTLYAFFKAETADKICHVCSLISSTYAKFLSGQCVEACILGSLMFIAFSVFKLPYAGLVAALTGFCAFIPYVGAFFSFSLGILLTLIASPAQVLIAAIVYVVVQFIENQFIYPHVVGGSVGLSPIWTLIAALVGGKLFGLIGIVFFIPLFAVISRLFNEVTEKRLNEKEQEKI